MEFLVNFIGATICHWHFPFVDKKFNLNHYFEIEKALQARPNALAFAVVSTDGHGSNIAVKAVQWLSKNVLKRQSKSTHALIIINNKDKNFRAAEMVGAGMQETTLLSSIGNRDHVKILVPKFDKMPEDVCNQVLDYVNRHLVIDAAKNIPYDLKHDITNPRRYDCSSLCFHAINYAYKKCGIRFSLLPVKRWGQETWTPSDVEYCELFETLYDSKIGLISANS